MQIIKLAPSRALSCLLKLGLSRRWRSLLPLLVFGAATFFVSYPVSLYPGSLIMGRPFEDAFEAIGFLYWYKHALFDLRQSPLFRPDVFYPFGWDLRFAAYPPLYLILVSPLTAVAGPVLAYNLVILASCVFAAYGMYLAVRAIGGGVGAGILAGLAFAFYPQREVYLSGWLHFLVGSMWLPWMLLGIIRAAQVPDRPTRWVVLTFFAYAMALGGAWQFVFLAGAVLAVGGGIYWLPILRRAGATWVRPLCLGVAVWCVIALPLLGGALAAWRELDRQAQFAFANVDFGSVSIERLLVPSALNPLWWDFARKTFPLWNGPSSVVCFGYTVIALAFGGLLRAPRGGTHVRAGLILWLGAIIFMLGPTLHFWGKPVSLVVPPALLAVGQNLSARLDVPLVSDGAMRIPLPWLLLYLLFPPLRSFHEQGRWGLVGMSGLAMLAGLGLTRWTARLQPGPRIALTALSVVLLMIEFNTQPLRPVISTAEMRRSVDEWLAQNAGSSVIIEYPLSYTMKGQSLYYTMAHRQKIVHGYSPMRTAAYNAMIAVLARWPEPAALDMLNQIGVRYVLVHAFVGDAFEDKQLPRLLATPQLKLIEVFPTPIGNVRSIYLFELVSSP